MKKAYSAYLFLGGAWRLLVAALLVALVYWNERAIDTALPRVEGKPGALREALGFPWQNFPEISKTERNQLDELIPLDPAIRVSDIRPWTAVPSSGVLGGADVARNQALVDAFDIINDVHVQRQRDPSADLAERIAAAKQRLTAAQAAATLQSLWLVHYNRGVLYGWERSPHNAATQFERAARQLNALVRRGGIPEEVRIAAIHANYAWGDALISKGATGGELGKAFEALRAAAFEVKNLFDANPGGTAGHAAEFFPLQPTGLSTGSLRNDLLAAYLGAPQYTYCGKLPMEPCGEGSPTRPCRYRDERFCKTKGREPLQSVFEAQLNAFRQGAGNEATVWALQNAVEIDSENPLHDEPVVAYNIAKVLLDLKRPDLAYRVINPVVTGTRSADVTLPILRLSWVSSILAHERISARPAGKPPGELSAYRLAFMKLYPKEPLPFEPLQLDDPEKAKKLDAWLFIRRYRDLLRRGELETFIHEHRRFHQLGQAPRDFLATWKSEVVVAFLRRAKQVRDKAQPATKEMIDDFLSRSDLFTDEELEKAELRPPFAVRKLRGFLYGLGFAAIGWMIIDFLWRLRAYRSTFESAYQRDRARAGA